MDDPARGRQITTDNEDLSYQNKLKLFSMNSGYIIGYKRDANGVEYRYLADANGNIVNAVNAKATANLGAGEQELDTATVVPENTTVTVTANLPEAQRAQSSSAGAPCVTMAKSWIWAMIRLHSLRCPAAT